MTYSDRLAELDAFVQRLDSRIEIRERLSTGYSRVRLAIVVLGAFLTVAAERWASAESAWIVGTAAGILFLVAAHRHSRVLTSLRKHRIYRGIKIGNSARIRRDWTAIPFAGLDEAPSHHPFARDLNLSGPRSLHHLLDTSFTREGSSRLRAWLLSESPDIAGAKSRQQLTKDLAARPAFRDRIALISRLVSADASSRWEGNVLLRWLEREDDRESMVRVLLILAPLALATPILFALNVFSGIGPWWTVSLLTYVAIYLFSSRLYGHLFDEAEHLYSQLTRFRPILSFLEGYRCQSAPALQAVVSTFQGEGRRPSAFLRTVTWLAVAASAQKNDVFRLVLNLLVPWELFFAWRLSLYKERLRDRLPAWLDTIQTLEAASSLGAYAHLNPESTFPDLLDDIGKRSVLTAESAGHPLIPEHAKVRNSVSIEQSGTLLLITGSNMSGKSTFLRTIGVNLVLANAGGAVDADFFRVPALRLFACMNVTDSVNDGISYFYAEVKRLSRLLTEARRTAGPPMLYLVDEIFRGTNNRERLQGSRALLRALLASPAIGLVSTHDLELTILASESDRIINYHFREHIRNGRMVFDYLLHAGPCPTTNALKIMEMEGLPVGKFPDSGD